MMRFAISLLVLLVACGPPTPGAFWEAGYWWEPDPNAEYCPGDYDWIKMWPTMVLSICGEGKLGCRIESECTVVSMYDESEAKLVVVSGTGEPHWAHEMRHLRKQLRHPLNA